VRAVLGRRGADAARFIQNQAALCVCVMPARTAVSSGGGNKGKWLAQENTHY
jgi:hypothetical protein